MEKMTLKEMYVAIKGFVNGEDVAITVADIENFCDDRIEKLNKKSTSKSKKVDEAQVALMNTIYDCLATEVEPLTVSMLMANHEVIAPTIYSNQKISAMLKKLVGEGRVVKTVNKGKTYFAVV